MTITSHARGFAALLLAVSLLLALGSCGPASTAYSVDRSPETSFEAPVSPAGGESTDPAEPSDLPADSAEPSEESEVSASPEASEPSEENSPDPDEAPSPDAAEPSASPEIAEPASAEPSPETGADEEQVPSSEAPSGTEASPEDTSPSGVLYVLNTNSMKFHLPTCSSVGKMKAHNRLDSSESRDAIIAKGYSPCKNCKP